MSVQIIEKAGKPEYAVIPYAEYQELLQVAQEVTDSRDADAAMAEIFAGEDESIPADIARRLITGEEHPLKVWREYRGFTQEGLGKEAEIGKSYVSQIEAGVKVGSTKVLKALGQALRVDVDDLLI
jgi:DNA-binding XRE family transcriptional regulator